MKKSALILIDLQNDFMPGGALPIPHADEIIPVANQIMHEFSFVVATKNWYPKNYTSFASHYPGKNPGDTIMIHNKLQKLWPDHCIQHTIGAELAHGLDHSGIDHIFCKGAEHNHENYSAFFNTKHTRATGLHTLLKFHEIKKVFILGLATEFCVAHTALDALQLGYQVYLITDACRGINLQPNDSEKTLAQLAAAQVKLIHANDIHSIPQQLHFNLDDHI